MMQRPALAQWHANQVSLGFLRRFADRFRHFARFALAKTDTAFLIADNNQSGKTSMIRVPLREGRTLHHDVRGKFGAGQVICRAAPPGTGIIAGGPMRAVFETLGVQDVVAKSNGSHNPYNMVKATFTALATLQSPRAVATRRGRKVSDILCPRAGGEDAKEATDG